MLARQTTFRLFILLLALCAVAWFETRMLSTSGLARLPASLLPVELAKASTLQVETVNGVIQCRRVQGRWRIEQPAPMRADSMRIDYLLEKIARAGVHDKVTLRQRKSRSLDLDDYGLVPPRAVISVAQGADEASLRIGGDAPGGATVFAMMGNSSDIVVVDRAVFDALPASADDFRDRALVQFPAADIRGIEIRRAGKGVVKLERDNGVWSMTSPYAMAASADAVKALLAAVENAAIETFVHAAASRASDVDFPAGIGAAYGLDPVESPLSVIFHLASEVGKATLTFGRQDTASPEHVYIAIAPDNIICTVHRSILDAFQMDAQALRERRVFPIPPANVAALSTRGPGGAFSLRREGQPPAWRIVQPSPQPADPNAAAALVADILALAGETATPLTTEPEPPPGGAAAPVIQMQVASKAERESTTAFIDFPVPGTNETAQVRFRVPRSGLLHAMPVASLPDALRDALLGSAGFAAIRDRTVLDLAPGDATALTRRADGAEETVVLGGDGQWFSAKAAPAAVDAQAVDDVLRALSPLTAAGTAALVSTRDADFGLASPLGEWIIATRIPARPIVILHLGRRREDGSLHARVKGEDAVFVLPPETADILAAPLLR
ncbi:MAG: DUF4340 domain-containing protein [Kiritimatiellia bacterium]|jgi:hypothetical protein